MKSVAIVGVGALGSHVVQFLRNEDVQLTVIDFDRIEQKNVLSQFHSKSSVGKSKVNGLAKTMDFLWKVKINTKPTRLTADNLAELLRGQDVIVDCLDNAESRKLLIGYGLWTGIGAATPVLHGALAADAGFGRVMWNDHFEADDAVSGAATCEDGEHLPFIVAVSAYMARAVQHYLKTGKEVGFQILPTGAVIVV